MKKKNFGVLLLTGMLTLNALAGCGATGGMTVTSESSQSYLEQTEIPFENFGEEFIFHTKESDRVTDVEAPSIVSYAESDVFGGKKKYTITMQMQFDDMGGSVCNNLFDGYTGTLLPNPVSNQWVHGAGEPAETNEESTTITFNKKKYAIKYELTYEFSDDTLATVTYNINAPADYKGLGMIMASYSEDIPTIKEPTSIEESGITKMNEVHYYKIGEF